MSTCHCWSSTSSNRALVILGSGEGEREEWRCLLVARLKVCSIAERGPGGGRTSSRRLARGVDDGGQLACAQQGLAAVA